MTFVTICLYDWLRTNECIMALKTERDYKGYPNNNFESDFFF